MKTKKPEDRRRKTEVGGQRPRAEVRNPKPETRRQISEDGRRRAEDRGAAAVGYLSRFLCVGFALALLVTGCVGPRPFKGGRAVTARNSAGVIEQTLVQGENPSQATKQDQETVKVRTYTVPVGSREEQSSASAFHEDLLSPSPGPGGTQLTKAGFTAGRRSREHLPAVLINPRHKPPHLLLVVRILREFLPEPAFLPSGLGIEERAQGQRCQ